MPMPIIPKSLYPLVPNAPGVPTLLRNTASLIDNATGGYLGLGSALDLLTGAEPVLWGVFDSQGIPVAVSDSVLSFAYRNSSRISDYPMEAGSFASYNKVASPNEYQVRLVRGGTQIERSDFVNAIDAAAGSLNLYTILTPEKTYLDVNIESWDYRREQTNGAYVIIADLMIREVRQTATAAFSAPKNPASSNVDSQGQVQTFSVVNPAISVRTL
jgi:hypothetical protein